MSERNVKRKIIVVFTVFLLLASAGTALQSAAAATTFGQTAVGSGSAWQPANLIVGSRFTSSAAGVVSSVLVYINNPTSAAVLGKCALYKESDKTLLAVTGETSIGGGSKQWQTFSILTPPSLTAGASYSIVATFASSGIQIACTAGTSLQSWYATQTYGTYPVGPYSSLAGYKQENIVYSIYATSSTTPSPTPTPTASPSPSPTPAATTFGQTAVGSGSAWQPANLIVGSRFTSSAAGVVSSVLVYINNPTSAAVLGKCALYKESDKTLLAVTGETSIGGGSKQWQTFSILTPPSLTAGASYSIVATFASSGIQIACTAGTSLQSWYATQTYGTYPVGPYSSLAGYKQENIVYSIYATSSTTPSPTPTPTASPSPSPTPAATTFGQTAVGSGSAWQPANLIVGSRFTSSAAGVVSSVLVYINNPTSAAVLGKCALYKESDKTLLAVTGETSIGGGSKQWQTFSILTPPSLTAGASYSIVATFASSGVLVGSTVGTASQSWYATQTYGTYPVGPYSSLAGYKQENIVYSIYATSSTTPSPTPTPTASPSPSPTPAPTPIPGANNLHTSGVNIYDSYNNQVVWNGVTTKTLFGYEPSNGVSSLYENYGPNDIDVIRNHGLNFIRLDVAFNSAVYGVDYRTQTPTSLKYNPRFWTLLDSLVSRAQTDGVWVYLNFACTDGCLSPIGGYWGSTNGFPKWMYDGSWSYFNKIYSNDGVGLSNAIRDFWNINDPTAANVRTAYQTFWRDIASHFRNSPNVVFGLFNEPQCEWGRATVALWDDANGHPSQAQGAAMYKAFVESTIDVIRSQDGGAHIISVDLAYLWYYSSNLQIQRPNVVIKIDSYQTEGTSTFNLAWRYNQPFLIGEFGGVEQGLCSEATAISQMQVCNQNNVGWTYMRYNPGYTPSAQIWTDMQNNLSPKITYYHN